MNKRKTYWLFIFNFFTCSPDIPHVYLTENKDMIINCTLMLNRNLIMHDCQIATNIVLSQ